MMGWVDGWMASMTDDEPTIDFGSKWPEIGVEKRAVG